MTSFLHDSKDLAETYDRVSDMQLDGGKRLVERLGFGEGASVLDVGCGTGRLARWIAERVGPTGKVAGIDPLEERVAIARARRGGLRFEVGQAEDLGAFEDGSFDVVCMSAVLHWIPDKAKALSEVRRVLRPGGRLGVTTLAHELRMAGTIALVIQSLLQRPSYAGHIDLSALTFATRGTSLTDLVSLLLGTGLELVELHVLQRLRTHASGEDLAEYLQASSFGNFLRIVSDDLRPTFRAELVAAFDAQKGPQGIVVRDWGVVFVAGRP